MVDFQSGKGKLWSKSWERSERYFWNSALHPILVSLSKRILAALSRSHNLHICQRLVGAFVKWLWQWSQRVLTWKKPCFKKACKSTLKRKQDLTHKLLFNDDAHCPELQEQGEKVQYSDSIHWQNEEKMNLWPLHGFIVKTRDEWDALRHEESVRSWICSVQNLPPQADGTNLTKWKYTIFLPSDFSCTEDVVLSHQLFWMPFKKSLGSP